MPTKALICKECKASFYPETTIQRITKTCRECIKNFKPTIKGEIKKCVECGNLCWGTRCRKCKSKNKLKHQLSRVKK